MSKQRFCEVLGCTCVDAAPWSIPLTQSQSDDLTLAVVRRWLERPRSERLGMVDDANAALAAIAFAWWCGEIARPTRCWATHPSGQRCSKWPCDGMHFAVGPKDEDGYRLMSSWRNEDWRLVAAATTGPTNMWRAR